MVTYVNIRRELHACVGIDLNNGADTSILGNIKFVWIAKMYVIEAKRHHFFYYLFQQYLQFFDSIDNHLFCTYGLVSLFLVLWPLPFTAGPILTRNRDLIGQSN